MVEQSVNGADREPLRGGEIPSDLNPYGYRTLPDFFDDIVRRYAERPAFTSFGRTLSYAELDRLAAAFACYLQRETGLQPGDRLAIQLPNLIQYPVVLFGALRAGLVIVNTNPLYTPAEMAHQFRDSGAKALVVHKSMAHKVEAILEETEIEQVFVTQVGDLHGFAKRHLINAAVKYLRKREPDYHLPTAIDLRGALLKYLGENPERVERAPSDLAALQYTGGTTGISKGAMLTHANLLSNLLQGMDAIEPLGTEWAEIVVSPLPLYHIYAFTLCQVVLGYGGHNLLIADPRDLSGFIKELRHWRISAFIGLNTLFVALCNDEHFRALDFSGLRLTLSGGMALTGAAGQRWQEVTGCAIVEAYGLTEASPAVSINPPLAIRAGTIGKPLAHTEVVILGPRSEQLGEGQPGDLCVKGPQVMVGYWRNEAATRASFTRDGYLISGDIAQWEAQGYLRIVDRAKDLIIVSGFNVYPNEVEDVASSHPGIVECAAIGLPDPACGEVVKLFAVRLDDAPDAAELQQWCSTRLARYKVPKTIEFVDQLPKSNVGKVLRRALRDKGKNLA